MHMPRCFLLFLVCALGTAQSAEPDCDGCSDALLPRYPASQLVGHNKRAYEQAVYPQARIHGADEESSAPGKDTLKVSGKRTQLFYWEPEGRSGLEVFSNYQRALSGAGMSTIWSCSGSEECGDEFAQRAIETMHLNLNNTTEAREGAADAEEPRYILAKSQAGGSEVYVAVLVADLPLHTPPHAGAYVMVTEIKAMETGMVTTDAQSLEQRLEETHKAEIYGILFDFDQAVIKPESKPQLDQIARLLVDRPQIKLRVVGHTDNQGGVDYNFVLSEHRAEAVVAALVNSYGIAPGRLSATGKGASSPIASNDTDDGRAKNRRVELIQQ